MKLCIARPPHDAIKSQFAQNEYRRLYVPMAPGTEPVSDVFDPRNIKELKAELAQWKKGNTDGTDLHHWFTEIKTAEHQRAFLNKLPLLGCCREGEFYQDHVCEFGCSWTSADWARELDYECDEDGYNYESCTLCTGYHE